MRFSFCMLKIRKTVADFVFAICLLIPLTTCAKTTNAPWKAPFRGHKVFDSNDVLHFDHRCSEADRHSNLHLSSLAFFDRVPGARGYKATAYVRLEAGYVNFVLDKLGFNLRLHQLKIESLSWIRQKFSLHLRLVNLNTNEVINGQATSTFVYFLRKDRQGGRVGFYQTSNTGDYDHLNLVEEEGEKPYPSHLKRRNVVPGIAIYRNQISHLQDPHAFFLILTNLQTKEEVALIGPRMNTLNHKMDGIEERTNGKVVRPVGFFEMLNPFSERSLFGGMRHQLRYDKCYAIKPVAEQQFIKRFNAQKL